MDHPERMPEEAQALAEKYGKFEFEYIEIPAVLDEGTPKARASVPQRWSMAELAHKRITDEFEWKRKWQQSPQPRGDKLFSEHWALWEPARDSVGRVLGFTVLGEWIPMPDNTGRVLLLGADTAGSEAAGADWTAVVLMSVTWEMDSQIQEMSPLADIVHVWRDRLKSSDVVVYVASILRAVPNAMLAFEAEGEGRAQADFHKRDYKDLAPFVRTVTTGGRSKRLRAMPLINYQSRLRVRLPAFKT
jgi:hypothetical protein